MATSSKVKNRWNQKHYRTWGSQIKPELFDRIQAYCDSHELSKSKFLTAAIELLEKEDAKIK